MTDYEVGRRRRFRAPPRPGTDRWFRGYRRYLLWAWAVVLLLCFCMLVWHDDRPAEAATPPTVAAARPLPEKAIPAPAAVVLPPASAKSRK